MRTSSGSSVHRSGYDVQKGMNENEEDLAPSLRGRSWARDGGVQDGCADASAVSLKCPSPNGIIAAYTVLGDTRASTVVQRGCSTEPCVLQKQMLPKIWSQGIL